MKMQLSVTCSTGTHEVSINDLRPVTVSVPAARCIRAHETDVFAVQTDGMGVITQIDDNSFEVIHCISPTESIE